MVYAMGSRSKVIRLRLTTMLLLHRLLCLPDLHVFHPSVLEIFAGRTTAVRLRSLVVWRTIACINWRIKDVVLLLHS